MLVTPIQATILQDLVCFIKYIDCSIYFHSFAHLQTIFHMLFLLFRRIEYVAFHGHKTMLKRKCRLYV